MPDEIFWQLRFEPAKWIAEKHVVKVYVGTDGLHQDEFLRGDHPTTLFRGSIATPSLEAAIINAKYVNSNPLDRIARDFQTNGLEQYHKIARELDDLQNANCFAHARRHFANAIKAIGKGNQEAIKSSIAYKALVRIGAIYDLEGALKNLSPEERLKERQASIKPLVEEYFAWVKEALADMTVLPKGETAKGLKYSVNQEEYLKVFLSDGEVPIDDSASERAL